MNKHSIVKVMTMKRMLVLTILISFFIATSADAGTRSRRTHKQWIASGTDRGMYVSGSLGIGLLSDAENNQSGTNFEFSYDLGFNAGGAIGYDFGSFRAEAELAYHRNDVDLITFSSGASVAIDGTVSALSLMANGYYDFGSRKSFLAPYLGLGAGLAMVNEDVSISSSGLQLVDDSAAVFAYQLMAGVGFNISPNTTLTVGYRYFATMDPELDDASGVPFDSEYQSHDVMVGIRFAF